jgi:hypothetical protein
MALVGFQAGEEITRISGDNKVKVTLSWIGEGFSGDYDMDNPDDVPLLRYDVFIKDENGEWVDPGDASYCTLLSAEDDMEILEWATEYILDIIHDYVLAGEHKKMCEVLSWINAEWIMILMAYARF